LNWLPKINHQLEESSILMIPQKGPYQEIDQFGFKTWYLDEKGLYAVKN
jgi:hypothetical protein